MTVSLTQASYPSRFAFDNTPEFCYVLKKILKACYSDREASLEDAYPGICKNLTNDFGNPKEIKCPLDIKDGYENVAKKWVVEYARDNIAKVNIFLKDPFVNRYVRDEKITWGTFFGTIGGILGLCLGFSVISIFEIVYLSFLGIANLVWNQFSAK